MSGLRWSQEQLDATLKGNGVRGLAGEPKAALKSPVAPAKDPRKRSPLEVRLEQDMVVAGVPMPMLEYHPIPGRGWRMDFSWPTMTPPRAVEVNGAAHRISSRFYGDMEKRQHLFFAGWLVLEVSGRDIRDGSAIEMVKKLLEMT